MRALLAWKPILKARSASDSPQIMSESHMSVMDRKVTVCGACETAACWQGSFYCDYAEMSGTKEFTVRELHQKPRGENAEYWFKDPNTGKIDQCLLEEFRRNV
jgi:hypothetical protein